MSEKLTTLYKPCGKEMRVNSNSLKHALSLGWSENVPTKKKKKRQNTEQE